MRHATAYQLFGRRHAPISNAPCEGTKRREVYDLFQANKGWVISFTRPSAYITESSVDYYGLDLRCIRQVGLGRRVVRQGVP
jgi:hypothetical protein